MKKPRTKITPKKRHSQKIPYNRGAIGPGMAYALLALLVVISGGALMVGNIIPNGKAPKEGQPVIIQDGTAESAKSNLQLNYFKGVTYTPSPKPTTIEATKAQPASGNNPGSSKPRPPIKRGWW